MQSVAIVGLGLIGGSFALALRKAGFTGEIAGVDDEPFLDIALRRGIISRALTLKEAADNSDLLYLSRSVEGILSDIRELSGQLSPSCLVTDVGSTKSTIVEHAQRYLPKHQFLPGHPMAGKEVSGIDAAEADLFANRTYVLCSPLSSNPVDECFRKWLDRMKTRVLELPPDEHDAAVASTSHLPQLLSTALALTLRKQDNPMVQEVFGRGLMDMTRLAASSPRLWRSILATNKEQISQSLAQFEVTLSEVRRAIECDDTEQLFSQAGDFASEIRVKFSKG